MTAETTDSGWLARWARFAVRHRRAVLLAWLAALAVLVSLWRVAGAGFVNSFRLPGTESQQALTLLRERFPQRAGDQALIVFRAEAGVAAPEIRSRVEAVLAAARTLPKVVAVGSPFEPGGQGAISPDGRVAFATLQYAERAVDLDPADVRPLLDLVEQASGDGLTVEAGGNVVQRAEYAAPGVSEAIGVVAAVFILLVAFGSVVAMGLPVVTALVGLGTGVALLALGANWLELPVFTNSFAAMIGLGVGIDYALFVVTRYREGLARGLDVTDSVAAAVSSAGRAVIFAGTVVVVSLLGLLAIGIPFVGALGVAGAIVVAIAVVIAVTLLPALLGFTGRAIDRWRLPLFHATDTGDPRSLWYRLSRQIQQRPAWWFIGALALLLTLAAPVLRMHLGFSDAGNASTRLHSRRAYDLLAQGFSPGFNGPLLIVADMASTPAERREAALEAIRAALSAWPGIVQVSRPVLNPTGDAATLTAIPASAPQDEATQRLIHDLRRRVLPSATADTGTRAYVAGQTAAFIDIGDRLRDRMPLFFGTVLGLSFLLLVVVFRSILVPLKAAAMNLLSIGAAYGVEVAVFQWGWGAGVLGVKPGVIEVFLPLMLFAVLFGLSMDYEVFLISRIREEYARSRDNAAAVARGLAVTARVITAAAAIMVVVFLSFVLTPERVIKEFGVGLATAVLVDATVVRLILVPATMELLGDANWWLPRWLDRLLPRLSVEERRPAREPAAAAD
jgi:RND superfamily putative drug exporter